MTLPSKKVRVRIRDMVNQIQYDFRHFSLDPFLDHLSSQRPKPFHLIRYPSKSRKPIGLWLPHQHCDYIVVTDYADMHPVQQEHIVLHEVAHALLDHPPIALQKLTPEQRAHFFKGRTNAEAGMVLTGRARTKHEDDDPYEREAEYMATLLSCRILKANYQYGWQGKLTSIDGLESFAARFSFYDTLTDE